MYSYYRGGRGGKSERRKGDLWADLLKTPDSMEKNPRQRKTLFNQKKSLPWGGERRFYIPTEERDETAPRREKDRSKASVRGGGGIFLEKKIKFSEKRVS